MKRRIIDACMRLLTRMRRRRRVFFDYRPLKVNAGSGLSVAPGWVHVDASLNAFFAGWPRPFLYLLYRLSDSRRYYSREEYIELLGNHEFVHHDLTWNLPFPDASVDYLYSSHMLEHFTREQARRFVQEAHRVLREGGVLRICVPDLSHVLDLFRQGEKERALDYFFLEEFDGALGRHRWLYDFDLLADLLREARFEEVHRCAAGEGATPDLDRLDNRPEESLYVEAVR